MILAEKRSPMLQVQRQHIIGIVVCVSALIGARWLYVYHTRKDEEQPLPELDSSRHERKIKKPSRHTSQSIKSTSQMSLLGLDTAASVTSISSWTNQTSGLVFFDVEPNLHFFRIYQDQLAIVDSIPIPRTDRTESMLCESQDDFLAKVSCLRNAFQDIIYDNDNCFFFINSGKEILKFFLAHSETDLENCLEAYDKLLD